MTPADLKARTKAFALRISTLVDALPKTTQGRAVAGQIFRSGTSVAANYRAACRARSRAEFIAKIGVVEEEADETLFWLEFIVDAGLLDAERIWPLAIEADELVAIMAASRKSAIANRHIGNLLKICDLTQFYSPLSGGVKRYVHEKINYIQARSPDDEHILIIPGPKTEVVSGERSRIYSIRSPFVSRSSRYRALLNLRAIGEILERERPDIIESGDPYQVGWKAVFAGRSLKIPVVGFYHSHFPEAYLRGPARLLRAPAQRYVRALYNRFEATLVPSQQLARVLENWGVDNVRTVNLGVNTETFSPTPDDATQTRNSLGMARPETSPLRGTARSGKKYRNALHRLRNAGQTPAG